MQMTQALATAILAATSVSAIEVPHSGTEHIVSVGADKQKVYFPNHFNAAPGDAVAFSFHVGNHSVTQSSFEEPCKPLKGGVNSGFVFQAIENNVEFFLEINNTKPIWFYCGQADHCRSGMVGSINAPTTGNTFEKFLANAKAVKQEDIVQDNELRGGIATKFRAVDPSPVFTRTILPADETGAPASVATSSTVKTYAPSTYVKTWTYTTSENNQVKTVTTTASTTAPASTVTVAVGGGGGADSTGKGSGSSSSSSKAAAPAVTGAPILAGAAMLAAAALL